MKNVILALVLIVLASPLYAEEAYTVNVGIYQDGNLIGSPSLVLQPGVQASVKEGKKYSLKLTVDPVDAKAVRLTTNLAVDGENISPAFFVELGKESAVKAGSKSLSVIVTKASS